MRKAAEALAALQLEHIPTPQHHPLPNEVAALERTGTILRWACPYLGAEIEETVGTVVASLEEVPPAQTHRDLKLDHILLDGNRPSLVDLDNFAAADPVLDVANVLAHLKSMPFRFPLTLEDSGRRRRRPSPKSTSLMSRDPGAEGFPSTTRAPS